MPDPADKRPELLQRYKTRLDRWFAFLESERALSQNIIDAGREGVARAYELRSVAGLRVASRDINEWAGSLSPEQRGKWAGLDPGE